MILSNFKLQSLCTLIHYKILPEFYFNFTKVENTHQIALELQQALTTTKLNAELKKAKELWPLFDQR